MEFEYKYIKGKAIEFLQGRSSEDESSFIVSIISTKFGMNISIFASLSRYTGSLYRMCKTSVNHSYPACTLLPAVLYQIQKPTLDACLIKTATW